MSVFLLLLTLGARLILAATILAALAFTVWVLWDCLVGPSAHLAAEHRARDRSEVDGW